MKTKSLSSENGVTLTTLTITIIILVILAGIVITGYDDAGLINEAEETANTYYNEKKEEADAVDTMSENLDKSIVKLSQNEVDLIRNKIKTGNIYNINYEPQQVENTVTMDSQYSGVNETQNYNQQSIGALGSDKLTWYVLSADVNKVNLISSITNQSITFQDAGGYDNCLYYLNKIAKDLFANEELGVTSGNIHAFRLTDLKVATEQINGSEYNWKEDMIKEASLDAYNEGSVGMKSLAPEYKKYPQLYNLPTINAILNNSMYDEESNEDSTPISGDLINSTSSTASTLKARYTHFSTSNELTTKELLGNFGNSSIINELISTDCWLASRSITADSTKADYNIRGIFSNHIGSATLCSSNGSVNSHTNPLRIVVSIPASHISVSNDGTISLK